MFLVSQDLNRSFSQVMIRYSSIGFTCNFGQRNRFSSSGLSNCGMIQSTPNDWGTVSGHCGFGRDFAGDQSGKLSIYQEQLVTIRMRLHFIIYSDLTITTFHTALK